MGFGKVWMLFALPPDTGDVLGYIPLANQLPEYAFYAFNFIEPDDRIARYADLIESTLNDTAGFSKDKDNEEALILFGYSAGGNLACHVAKALENRGRTVSDIIMIDSSRKMNPYAFALEEIKTVTQQFLNHETIAPYLENVLLRDKVAQKIARYYQYVGNSTDYFLLSANLHVILAENYKEKFIDANGTLIVDQAGWSDVTKGAYRSYQGLGHHNDMLYDGPLSENLAIIKEILAKTLSLK
jgi:thioesterase domain-containing protein